MSEQFPDGPYEKVLVKGDVYEIRQLRQPRVADNMQFIWNYALINTSTGITEIHTDTFPGAVLMFIKLEDGHRESLAQLAKYQKAQARSDKRIVHASTH